MPRHACVIVLTFVLCLSPNVYCSAGGPTNDTFATATVLPPGTLMVADTLEGAIVMGSAPDTYLGFFADDTFTLPPLAEDDDDSPLGDGLGSGLFGIPVNSDGSIPLAVTGCCDDFDGTHIEEGDYELFVDVFDSGGAPLDAFSVTSTLAAGAIDEFPFADPAWIGGSFDAVIDNTTGFDVEPGDDPLDFWKFTGLPSGAPYVAEITAGDFDTILASFDSGGTLDDIDDDSGFGLLSALEGTIPVSGELVLAVTGFDDFLLGGFHAEAGAYELTVTIVPEPTAMMSLVVGLIGFVGVGKRRG